jgi:hypothetical protein
VHLLQTILSRGNAAGAEFRHDPQELLVPDEWLSELNAKAANNLVKMRQDLEAQLKSASRLQLQKFQALNQPDFGVTHKDYPRALVEGYCTDMLCQVTQLLSDHGALYALKVMRRGGTSLLSQKLILHHRDHQFLTMHAQYSWCNSCENHAPVA